MEKGEIGVRTGQRLAQSVLGRSVSCYVCCVLGQQRPLLFAASAQLLQQCIHISLVHMSFIFKLSCLKWHT